MILQMLLIGQPYSTLGMRTVDGLAFRIVTQMLTLAMLLEIAAAVEGLCAEVKGMSTFPRQKMHCVGKNSMGNGSSAALISVAASRRWCPKFLSPTQFLDRKFWRLLRVIRASIASKRRLHSSAGSYVAE